jgi:hypothetical protein
MTLFDLTIFSLVTMFLGSSFNQQVASKAKLCMLIIFYSCDGEMTASCIYSSIAILDSLSSQEMMTKIQNVLTAWFHQLLTEAGVPYPQFDFFKSDVLLSIAIL